MKFSKEEALSLARNLFDMWNEAIIAGDPEKVAELYTKDNIFLPTMASDMKFGKDGTIGYFSKFLIRHPIGKIVQDDVLVHDNVIIYVGLYNFEVKGESKDRQEIEARFTFVYRIDADGIWRIEHHHSSLRPNN